MSSLPEKGLTTYVSRILFVRGLCNCPLTCAVGAEPGELQRRPGQEKSTKNVRLCAALEMESVEMMEVLDDMGSQVKTLAWQQFL